MKLFFLLGLVLGVSTSCFAQGSHVNFANAASGLNAPVTNYNNAGFEPRRTSGPDCKAMLYIGPAGVTDISQLTTNGVAGGPATFGTGPQAGFFFGGARLITGVLAGQPITVAVKVWQGADSYEQAAFVGRSSLLQVTPSSPPTNPTTLNGLTWPNHIGSPFEDFPRFTTQPQSQTVEAGQSVTFSAITCCYNFDTPRYHWRFNGSDLPGATNLTLTLSNVQAAQAGAYHVVASNFFSGFFGGPVSSSTALLSVLPATPVQLTSLARSSNSLQFTLTGQTGSNYIIQSSTNLAGSNWISRSTGAAPFSFTDSNLTQSPQQFYRGVRP